MSSKLGALKERSKSETSQNRVKLRRPPKYKSLTLTRQNAKLNVSVTSDGGHMTSTPKIKASEACTCEDCDPPCSNNINANNSSICYEDETSLNTSTSTLQRFWRSFRTPSPAIRRIQSTTDPKISRSTSVRESPAMGRKALSVKDLTTSPSLTTLQSEGSRTKHVSFLDTPESEKYTTIDGRSLNSQFKSKRNLKDKDFEKAVRQFNLDPKKGLEYLSKENLKDVIDPSDPKQVANFLFREGRLSKKQIGAYLGGHKEFNQKVLSEFVSLHQFHNLMLVQALRQFLWSFRLPGEAMQIDRIMDSFAQQYCEQNPNLFEEKDPCYIMSFSIVMLNTALHNPNVKNKPSQEDFIKMNRGINSGKDLPQSFLEQVYQNIKEEPFKIPDENYDDIMMTFFSPEKEGWLLKQGGNWKSWKRRWFLLKHRCLYYFEHTSENKPKGIIPLGNVKVRCMEDTDGNKYLFEIYSTTGEFVKGAKQDSKGAVIASNHKSYRMAASSEEDRASWVKSIESSIETDQFYTIISQKKNALKADKFDIFRPNRNSLKRGPSHDIPNDSELSIVSSNSTSSHD